MPQGQVRVTLRWERHAYSRIEGEVFADVKGIGRLSIRRSKHDKDYFTLKLNGGYICSSALVEQLKRDAQNFVEQKMYEQGRDMDE